MIAGLFLATAIHVLAPAEPVVVREQAPEVVVVAGDVVLQGRVAGNVVVVFGDLILAPGAVVEGDAVVLGGSASGEGEVRGRKVVVGGSGSSGAGRWGLALLRFGFWSLASFAALLLLPRVVRRSGAACRAAAGASLAAGVGVGAFWLGSAVLGGVLLPGVLLPAFWAAWAVGLLGLKVVGVVGAAWSCGKALRLALPTPLRGEFPRTWVGAVLLVAFSLLPVVGEGVWVLANLLGLGAVARVLLAQLVPTWLPGASELSASGTSGPV
jgi:hypothetical protein